MINYCFILTLRNVNRDDMQELIGQIANTWQKLSTNNFSHVFIIELKKKWLVPDAQTLKNRKNFKLNFRLILLVEMTLKEYILLKKSLLRKYLIFMLLKQKILENIYRNTFNSYKDRCTYYDKLML